MVFAIGKVVGQYEILDVISSSRLEVAYRARNLRTQRIEMLRVLTGIAVSDQERMERFLREMRVHSRLAHPNIVSFYGASEIEGHMVMTTELVEGIPLSQRLELGPLPCQEAVAIAGQILSALSHAHQLGIVHRDIGAAKILMTPDGQVKIADFGLAKAGGSPHLTQVGVIVGNVKYTSPEQIRGTGAIDGRSDLYSAGLVLYEMLTGRLPFAYQSQFEMMAAHVSEIPRPPGAVTPGVPIALDHVVMKAIAKDPAQRFQTAEEFAAALQQVAEASIPQPQAAPEPPEPPRMPAVIPPEPAPPPVSTGLPIPALAGDGMQPHSVLGVDAVPVFSYSGSRTWTDSGLTAFGILVAALVMIGVMVYSLARM